MKIPALNDLEGMAKFFEDNPDWSPMLDGDGIQVGIWTPLIRVDDGSFYTEYHWGQDL